MIFCLTENEREEPRGFQIGGTTQLEGVLEVVKDAYLNSLDSLLTSAPLPS